MISKKQFAVWSLCQLGVYLTMGMMLYMAVKHQHELLEKCEATRPLDYKAAK